MINRQILRFFIIGTSASATHFIGVVCLVELFTLQPLIANIFAFFLAFQISYIGHRYWTFNHRQHALGSLPKFFTVASFGFIMNEGLFALCLHVFNWYYPIALAITLITVAIMTFILSKFWAFA